MRENGAKISAAAIAGIVAAVVLARYLLPVAIPFALGAALALAAEPCVRLLRRRLRLSRRAASAVGVSVCFAAGTGAVIALGSVLVRQVGKLGGMLPQLEDAAVSGLTRLEQWLGALSANLPGKLAGVATQCVQELFSDGSAMLEQAMRTVPQAAGQLVGTLSHGALALFTAIVSGYTISARLPALRGAIARRLPPRWRTQALPALRSARRAVGGWLLAQGKLMGITFGILLLGFALLRIDSALLYAALIAVVDAFPVLGTGTVLVPWSAVCLLQGDTARGLGLLGVYGAAWLARSILEPRLIGRELGLDPLVTLIALYAGFCLFGLVGMLLAPFAAMLAVQVYRLARRA